MIEGFGLHRGERATLRFLREDGPVRLRSGAVEARIDELVPDGSARSTTVRTADGRLVVATVEHVLAALEARAIRAGIVIALDGPEAPLADGGACAFVDALASFALAGSRPLVVAKAGTIVVGQSAYRFTPGDGVHVEVAVDFGDARIAPAARWDGDAADFRARIAPARTFGFEHELGDLLARGLARGVAPESVVVFTPGAVLAAGAPYTADEPARHKLLDLLGDLYLHGGAPRGALHATRPGHAATHEAMRRALAEGLLHRDESHLASASDAAMMDP